VLGHRHLSSTQVYAHTTPEQLRVGVERLADS